MSGRGGGISMWSAASLVVGGMIGTGIFVSLGYQLLDIRSPFVLVLLWAVGGVCALCGALCYAELAASIPRSGGEYHFLSRIYHPAVGFIAGWASVTIGFAGPVAMGSKAFIGYASALVPWLRDPALSVHVPLALPGVSGPLVIGIPEVLVIVGITLMHLWTVRVGSVFQDIFTALKIGALLLLIGCGLGYAGRQTLSFAPTPGCWGEAVSMPFAVSLFYVMYAYCGWNAPVYMMSEVRDARRNVPMAMLLGTLLVTAIYIALNAVFLLSAPAGDMAGQKEVAYIAARNIFGDMGGRVMAAIIALGLVSMVSANVWIGPRVAQTMGQDLAALGFLARTNRVGVPQTAIVMQAAIALLLMPFDLDLLMRYVQFTLQLCSTLVVFGVFVLRWREPGLERPYRVWLYPLPPLLFLGVSIWMLVYEAIRHPMESVVGFGTLLLGLALYFLSPKARENREGKAAE